MRGASPWVALVKERLAVDQAWRHIAQNGKWVCPFCLGAVARRQSRSTEDSIALHLDNCSAFAAGRGVARPLDQIASRQMYEDLEWRVASDPAWQVFDAAGTWICPACLIRVSEARRPMSGPPGGLVVRAMAGHLGHCQSYLQGRIHAVESVNQARDKSERVQVDPQVAPIARSARPPSGQSDPAQVRDPTRSRFSLQPVTSPTTRIGERPASDLPPLNVPPAATPTATGLRALPSPPVEETAVARALGPTARFGRDTPLPFEITPAQSAKLTPQAPSLTPPATAQAVAQPPPVARPPSNDQSALSPLIPRQAMQAVVPPVAAPPKSAGSKAGPAEEQDPGWSWMDDADAAQQAHIKPVLGDRTDVIRASKVQVRMLAEIPEVPGYVFATRFEPCDHVSGDFYTFVRRHDGTIAFAIGDVSGHGVQAGLVMSMAKKTIEIYAALGKGPADTLSMVNEAIAGDLAGSMFVSVTMAVLDPAAGAIRWARAGHNPSFRLDRQTGEVLELRPKGMVVGMKSGPQFRQALEEEVTTANPGDLFLLYTDGVTEAMNAQNDEFGAERLGEVIARASDDGPDHLLSQILDRVRHFRGSRPSNDDCTLVALAVGQAPPTDTPGAVA